MELARRGQQFQIDPGIPYSYRIRTKNDQWGETAWSPEITVTDNPVPAPTPIGAELNGEGTAIRISWEALTPLTGSYAVEYQLYRAAGSSPEEGDYLPLWDDYTTPGDLNGFGVSGDTLYFDDTDLTGGTLYSYRLKARISEQESLLSDATEPVETLGGVLTGDWITLGTDGFASPAENSPVRLAQAEGTLYALFSDGSDPSNRIKVMSIDDEYGSWNDVGLPLSLAAPETGDSFRLISHDNRIYAAYGETDVTVASGGSSRITVKTLDSGSWTSLGMEEGLSYENDTPPPDYWGVFGSEPALTISSTGPFLVYRGNGGTTGSLSYSGSGEYWEKADDAFWTAIYASETNLTLLSDGSPLAAIKTSMTEVAFYRFHNQSWSVWGSSLASTGAQDLEMGDLTVDGSGTVYLGWAGYSAADTTYYADVSSSNGGSWTGTGLAAALADGEDDFKWITDVETLPSPGGTGVIAAVAWTTGGEEKRVSVLAYDGADWTRYGQAMDTGGFIDGMDLTLDDSDRPVVIFANESGGQLRARAWRED